MNFLSEPWFWVSATLIGSRAGILISTLPQKNVTPIVVPFLIAYTVGRIVLPLPFCIQPRFDIAGLNLYIGGIIFIAGLAVNMAAGGKLKIIKAVSKPNKDMELQTTGIFSIVRNPVYLSEILWSLGWSVIFGSVIGVLLAPLWWGLLFITVLIEEKVLERELGEKYLKYKNEVKGRIFPGLSV